MKELLIKHSLELDLTTITWLVDLMGKQREDCLEEGKRFKKIASGEYGSPEEYGYKNREEFDKEYRKFTIEALNISDNCQNFIEEANRVLKLEVEKL